MSEITSITPQVKDKTRCNLFLDGRFYCGLTLEAVVRNRLKAGMEISAERLDEIQLESEKGSALDRALTFISASQKTEKQIADHLTGKGYLPAVVEYVLTRLGEFGYLDDGAYADEYVSSASKKKGVRLIRMELKNKGVADEHIAAATENIEGEAETAARILEKYMRGKPRDKDGLYKGFRYLLSKGFEYEVARDALKTLDGADGDGMDDL